MSTVSEQIQDRYQNHAKRFAWTCFLSLFLMLHGVGFALNYPLAKCIVLLCLAVSPTCLIAVLFYRTMSNPVSNFARRLKLQQTQIQELRLAMGLLTANDTSASEFDQCLRDRVLSRWQEPLSRACRLGRLVKSLLFFQIVLLVGMLISHRSTQDQRMQDQLSSEQLIVKVEPSSDVQSQMTNADLIASELLGMQENLNQISESTPNDALQDMIDQLNQHWQTVENLLADTQQTAAASNRQLQTASQMPLSGLRSLQSRMSRKALEDALSQDIMTYARQGARFDGPGMISRGQPKQISRPAANNASGRYHEYSDDVGQRLSEDVKRRIEQVPPRYRQTIARYLGAMDQGVKNYDLKEESSFED